MFSMSCSIHPTHSWPALRAVRSTPAYTHVAATRKINSITCEKHNRKSIFGSRRGPIVWAEQPDSSAQESKGVTAGTQDPLPKPASGGKTRKPESTDWISSQLTRRFGIAGGLAWFAFLAVGSLGEQVKTRLEVSREAAGAQDVESDPVTLPSGVVYQDIRIGGGSPPRPRDLVVLNYRAEADGKLFEDTYARGKPIVFPYKSRPFTGGMNAGVEEVLSTMRAGGKRKCTIPPEMGFGDVTYSIRNTRHAGDKDAVIPPSSTLTYEIELVRVSIPPS